MEGGGGLRVIFATYQSISVIATAQAKHELPQFDLIFCDEAHRTTGVTFVDEDDSNFVKVHKEDVIRGRKRIYMTATPRIYADSAKEKAQDREAVLASMDDPNLYGEILFHHGFAQAVENGILTDYRVIVLTVDEGQISTAVPKRLVDQDSELVLDDATKIIGCWKALSKAGFTETEQDDLDPMRRALAFCRSIKTSKLVRDEFEKVVEEFQSESGNADDSSLHCEVQHVDGNHNARERNKRIDWLKENLRPNVCRIISNARCLIEGVDVPTLDAILFLHPRNSQIDVVQTVGRVMRKAPGKQMGYVILPVGIPPDIPAEEALNNNQKYRVVWQVLNALRAHDERLDAVINQGRLGQDISNRIAIIDGRTPFDNAELEAVTAKVKDLPSRSQTPYLEIGKGGQENIPDKTDLQKSLPLTFPVFSRAIMAKLIEKCGTRDYWEDWAKDIAQIAERHVTRITALVNKPGSDAQTIFQDFLLELQDDLNESITETDAVEMLAQHMITRPVFASLFEGHSFVAKNPVSAAMTKILSIIGEAQIEREAKTLENFYSSVRQRAEGIIEPLARQNLIIELYEKFFRGAFPRTVQMLGIVYTPIEIVDFIIQSVNEALKDEFGQTLGSKDIHIIDPFVGTGTFITRLLQSDLIAEGDLERKYREEIHANEIVLLAYYIAAINIETVFHSVAKPGDYLPYTGICLTDTFALHESDDELSYYMKDNTDRRERQKKTYIQVIIGNPPYSFGQKSENDNAKNVAYKQLDKRIRATYAGRSNAGLLQNLYDSYIRAIRWGSDRLGKTGVMAYVTGSAWIERTFADGLRKCLAEEFTSVHVFHLRGDIRKNIFSGNRAGEGENVFGQRSMTGIAITVFVKNPKASEQGRILFHDVGKDLSRKQKLEKIKRYGSIRGIQDAGKWNRIYPDDYGDWLDQRDESLTAYLKIGDKKNNAEGALFENYSLGVVTNRDPWCVNFSRTDLSKNIKSTINFYNSEVKRWLATEKTFDSKGGGGLPGVDGFVTTDSKKISWSHSLKTGLRQEKPLNIEDGQFVTCMYRPFTKQWQFFSRRLNERVYQMTYIFPSEELPNRVISVTGKGARAGFSVLMADALPNHALIESGQCFPFLLYKKDEGPEADFFEEEPGSGYRKRHAITKHGLQHFRSNYPSETISYEDIFYYVYGLLHSESYREIFAINLIKDLPRIPCVKSVKDYHAFCDAGRRLGELHTGYEDIKPYSATLDTGGKQLSDDLESTYRVTKMRHPKTGKNKDRSTVIYNAHITIRNIPETAWEYIVGGKSALDWVMTYQCVKTDKKSGITNDANRYAIETIGDPRYPLDLFLRIITVSLETIKIVNSLPELSKESFRQP